MAPVGAVNNIVEKVASSSSNASVSISEAQAVLLPPQSSREVTYDDIGNLG
ncbi:hypothetical protein DY000_02020843 [Brassica cretica]|uniref:Uncharacterized protein n=1 Tax=Brassica cretica TaxID=69181 RepID=A0ABQ7E3C6_BRACR|nr:hypothetical protein DY000_02020843 [Brassica cretica]